MQEKIEIRSEEVPRLETPKDLQNFLIRHIEQIRLLIFAYHYAQKERVFNLEIGELVFKEGILHEGLFRTAYKINIFNGCSDLDLTEQKGMDINFYINTAQNSISITGENIPERYPDEF